MSNGSVFNLEAVMWQSAVDCVTSLQQTLGGVPNSQVPSIFEGVAANPPDTGQYVYVTMLPISSDHKLQTLDRYVRALQLDLYDQMNIGTGGLRSLRDQVDGFYLPRRIFSYTGQNATVIDTDESARREYGGYQVISFTVKFRASIVRQYWQAPQTPPAPAGPPIILED